MKEKLADKGIGFYFLVLAMGAAIISIIRYWTWASSHNASDMVVIGALVIGVAIDIILFVKDNDYLTILATACFSIALVRVLTDSVGSFVDAFQGINMFGDSTQVGTIISIASVMGISVVLSIIVSFLKRVRLE